jgi:hypothetical protein
MALTQVKTGAIADDAVTTDKLANAINTERTANTAKVSLDADSVTGAKIADDAVGAEHIEQLDADLSFADGAKAKFGAGNDLQIYHDSGGNSFIEESGSGSLVVKAADHYFQNADGTKTFIQIQSDQVDINERLDVVHNGSNNYIAEFQNTNTSTPYGLFCNSPSGAANGYPIISVSQQGASPATKFRVDSGTGKMYINVDSLIASNYHASLYMTDTGGIVFRPDGTSTRYPLGFQNSSGSYVGSVGITTSATSYNTSSDYRLKENVTAISDGITRLKTLKPSRFNFKVDPKTTVDGFLAHEVTAVPEAITGTKDEVDSNNDPVYQSIDQSKLVPLLTAALQEAVAKIEVLETKVAALEAA